MQCNLEFSLCMTIIVKLFLDPTFNNLNIPRLYSRVEHLKLHNL